MKSSYLVLSFITAVLILPRIGFAQGSSDESGVDSMEELINQLYEEREAAEGEASQEESSSHEYSEEECEYQPGEDPSCADETWDGFEDRALGTLTNSQPKKTGKHKGRAAPRKFKEPKQIQHANAEEKAYGPSGEDGNQHHGACKEKKKRKAEKPAKKIYFFSEAGSHG